MGASKYISKTIQNEWKSLEDKNYNYGSLMQKREIEFRKEKRAIVKVDKPTNLVSAKKIGYKSKQGIFVARVRVRKGSGTYHRPKNKRRPKRQGQAKLTRKVSIRAIAEQRASKKFENAETIGSYKVAEDGRSHYYEVVLVDRLASTIVNDKELSFLVIGQQGRAERGKTFAGGTSKDDNKSNKRKYVRKKKINKNNASK
ncbi:MAG: 50S ribosomal protein L15e [Candidatus ainarchaeum sp.]|nr:50S ribosomal protein L15e [Candidatus ainarchaeum sp.]